MMAALPLIVVLLLLASVGVASSEGEWVLWVKSSNLWVGYEDSSRGPASLGLFQTRGACLSRMEEIMNQVPAWNNGHGIPVTRDGDTLHLRIPSNPPRLATLNYSCVPSTS